MAKTVTSSFFTPLQTIYSPKATIKKFKVGSLLLLNFFLLLLLSLMTPLTTGIIDSYPALFVSTFVGIPIFLFILYSVLFIFISAFEGKSPQYWIGLLLFTTYTFLFIIISNIVNLFNVLIGTQNAAAVTTLLSVIVFILYTITLSRNLKMYFKTTYPRVFATLIIFFISMIILVYLQYLISNLQQY